MIEKEATFRALVEGQIWLLLPCILVTGAGMPDIATRAFLRHLERAHTAPGGAATLRFYGLFDWNPCGVLILCNYRAGSKRCSQEARECAPPRPCRRAFPDTMRSWHWRQAPAQPESARVCVSLTAICHRSFLCITPCNGVSALQPRGARVRRTSGVCIGALCESARCAVTCITASSALAACLTPRSPRNHLSARGSAWRRCAIASLQWLGVHHRHLAVDCDPADAQPLTPLDMRKLDKLLAEDPRVPASCVLQRCPSPGALRAC